MTKVKLCGMRHAEDILAANELAPEYIGFVFWPESRRCISYAEAERLKRLLDPGIKAVGVFVNEPPENVAKAAEQGIIDIAQLHGEEDEAYISLLRRLTDVPLIQAFVIKAPEDLQKAEKSSADHLLLDAGRGDGKVFDWALLKQLDRPYFLAGGLHPDNVSACVKELRKIDSVKNKL